MAVTVCETGVGPRLDSAVAVIAEVVEGFEGGTFSGTDAHALTEIFARGERLCAAGKAMAASRAADCATWTASGARSPEEWLAAVSGTGVGAARAVLDTADRLEHQPGVAEVFRSGELSVAQAAEISSAVAGVAGSDPGAETRLLEQARRAPNFGSLRRHCAEVGGAAASPEEDRARAGAIHAGRYLRSWADPDGAGRLAARLDPLAYARVLACLEPFQDQVFDAARGSERRESFEAYGADALAAMAEAAFANTSSSPTRVGSRVPSTVIAVVDHAALTRGHARPGETAEIVGVGPVPVEVIEEMVNDAFLATVVKDGCDIRSVAHPGRQATARQRAALVVRDRRCVNCGSDFRLETDHVDNWSDTHHTTLDQLALLCHHCHGLKTYKGWRLTGTPGDFKLMPPAPGGRSP
jgi:hypothetical protein